MYAIIRAGGKQAKVHEGDVLSVERIKDADTVSFTPLLVVGDDGTVISDRGVLAQASVTAEILGASAGPKVDIFKYKAKTGYRRRQGHRQKYTTIKVTEIVAPGVGTKKPKKAATATAKDAAVEEPSAETSKAKQATSSSKKPASKASDTKSATTKSTTKKPSAAKTTAKKQESESSEKE